MPLEQNEHFEKATEYSCRHCSYAGYSVTEMKAHLLKKHEIDVAEVRSQNPETREQKQLEQSDQGLGPEKHLYSPFYTGEHHADMCTCNLCTEEGGS